MVAEKCSFRVSSLNLVITLTKKLDKKWGSLTALPVLSKEDCAALILKSTFVGINVNHFQYTNSLMLKD